MIATPKFKEKSEGRPLDSTSSHHSCVHRWPLAMVRSIGKIASWHADTEIAKTHMIRRFRTFCATEALLERLEKVEVWTGGERVHRERPLAKQALWLIMGYRPRLHKIMNCIVRELNADFWFRHLWALAWSSPQPELHIAWKNVQHSLSSSIGRMVGERGGIRERVATN